VCICDEITEVSCNIQVMKSMTDNITEEKLLEEIGEITRLPMYVDRMAKDAKKAKIWQMLPQRLSR
jgi:hypothetical protein